MWHDISYDLVNSPFSRRGNLWLRPQASKPESKSKAVTQCLPSAGKHSHLQILRWGHISVSGVFCLLIKVSPTLTIVMNCRLCNRDQASNCAILQGEWRREWETARRGGLFLNHWCPLLPSLCSGSHPENREVEGHGQGMDGGSLQPPAIAPSSVPLGPLHHPWLPCSRNKPSTFLPSSSQLVNTCWVQFHIHPESRQQNF